jgi:hypothetical protein
MAPALRAEQHRPGPHAATPTHSRNPGASDAPGRVAVFFADFLFGEIKRKSGGVRGAAPAVPGQIRKHHNSSDLGGHQLE